MKVLVFLIVFVIAYFGGAVLLCTDEGDSPNALPKFCSNY